MADENTMRTLLVGQIFAQNIRGGIRYPDICYEKQCGWHVKHFKNQHKNLTKHQRLSSGEPDLKLKQLYIQLSAETPYQQAQYTSRCTLKMGLDSSNTPIIDNRLQCPSRGLLDNDRKILTVQNLMVTRFIIKVELKTNLWSWGIRGCYTIIQSRY